MKIKIKIIGTLCAVIIGAAIQNATAEEVRNPLYDLKTKDLCFNTDKGAHPASVDTPGADKIWYVKNEHIIDQIQKRYGLSIAFSKLKGSTPEAELKKVIAPCHEGAEDPDKVCKDDDVYKTDTKRFDDDVASAKSRRALLRLFKAAETGSANGFAVIVQPWNAPIKIGNEDRYEIEYKPFIDPRLDDILIGRFIDGGDQTPFKVACVETNGVKQLAPDRPLTLSSAPNNPQIENSVQESTPFDRVATTLTQVGRKRDLNLIKSDSIKGTMKFALLESPDEFAKSTQAGAQIGITDDESNGGSTLKADAALGWRFQWKTDTDWAKKQNYDRERTFTLTPFVAIDQNAVDVKRFKPTASDPLNITDESIAFAELSAGIRFDFEQNGRVSTAADYPDNLSRRTSYVGTRIPGWRVGGIWERFTDNNNNQHGERWGAEISPPAHFVALPGYRRPLQLLQASTTWADKDKVRKAKPLGPKHWLTGWTLEWDAELAIDRIDYLKAPLDFDTPFEGDRRDVDEFSVYGTNIGFDISKQSLFGYPKDKGWLSLSVDYIFRDGYENQDFGSAQKWEVDLSLSHPDAENLTIGIGYEIGRDFITLTETDIIALTLSAKY